MTCWLDLLETAFEVSWVDAGGVSTRTLTAGSGEDVLFLHGTSGHLEAFTRNIAAFVDAGFRCHALDLLGHGFTGTVDHRYEIPDYGGHVMDYMDAQDVGTAVVVGESIGGWIGAWVAGEHPERVSRLVLVAPGGTKANPAVMERIATSTRQAVESNEPALTRARLELLMHDPRDVTDELVDVRFRIYSQPGFRENLDKLLCLQEMDVRRANLLTPERLGQIKAPTLIVWGRENPFGDVPEAEAMHAAIDGSHLVLFEHCGHWPQHEHPARFNELVTGFLRTGKVEDPGSDAAREEACKAGYPGGAHHRGNPAIGQ